MKNKITLLPEPFISGLAIFGSGYRMLLIASGMFFLLIDGFAQSPAIQWQKSFGGADYDEPYAIIQSRDGGLVATGYTFSSDGEVSKNFGGSDAWIVKLDGKGNLLWQTSVGGSSDDYAYGIIETMDGGFVIAGATKSCEGNFSGNHGFSDGLLAKVDAHGKLLWTKIFGTAGNDCFNDVFENEDGSFVAAGTISCSENAKQGTTDFWLLKLNNNMKVIWSKNLGGTCSDKLTAAIKSNDGYILCGNAFAKSCNINGYHGKSDGLIIKANNEGDMEWIKIIGGSQNDAFTSCSLTADGGYLVAARTSSKDGNLSGLKWSSLTECWLLKLSETGDMEWQALVTDQGHDIVANTVLETNDSGYLIGGTASIQKGISKKTPQSFMMKFTPDRKMEWELYGNGKKEFGKAFLQTTEGSFIMAGGTFSSSDKKRNKGFEDFCVVKTEPALITSSFK